MRNHLTPLDMETSAKRAQDNIVEFREFYQDPPALVMELVHGIRLDESYKIVALDRRKIRDCTRQLSSAIA